MTNEKTAQRLAAALDLALHDAHPVYGSTAGWRGGIGGQLMTPGCSIIDPPAGDNWTWTQCNLLSKALREFVAENPDFDLAAAKVNMINELNDMV